jgi:ferredoxin
MIEVDHELCTGCSLCVPVCPEAALSCYGRASVDENCTQCLICVEFCPVEALQGPGEGEAHD